MIYFTSDLHLSHKNVVKHNNRPFETVEEMNEALIHNWNKRVGEDDEIYILGDLTFKGPVVAREFLSRLCGKKYFIRGNHDRFLKNEESIQDLFVWIKDYHELLYKERRFILFHYQISSWNHFYRKSIHLHGHQHNTMEYNISNRENKLLRYDVGVDANDFAPVSIEEIMEFFKEALEENEG